MANEFNDLVVVACKSTFCTGPAAVAPARRGRKPHCERHSDFAYSSALQ
jgi:hypothetical protein